VKRKESEAWERAKMGKRMGTGKEEEKGDKYGIGRGRRWEIKGRGRMWREEYRGKTWARKRGEAK
jgi:hypothetical protein